MLRTGLPRWKCHSTDSVLALRSRLTPGGRGDSYTGRLRSSIFPDGLLVKPSWPAMTWGLGRATFRTPLSKTLGVFLTAADASSGFLATNCDPNDLCSQIQEKKTWSPPQLESPPEPQIPGLALGPHYSDRALVLGSPDLCHLSLVKDPKAQMYHLQAPSSLFT